MKSCAICGSHAFNMAIEGVNQGAFCDRHYWQRKAESLEAARATPAPKVPQVHHACHCDLEPHQKPDGCVIDEGRINDCVYAKKLTKAGKGRDDCEYWQPIVVRDSATPALPQGVQDLIDMHGDAAGNFEETELVVPADALSGMAIVPVDAMPAALPMEPFQTIDMGSKNYKAGWNRCRLAMLAAAIRAPVRVRRVSVSF